MIRRSIWQQELERVENFRRDLLILHLLFFYLSLGPRCYCIKNIFIRAVGSAPMELGSFSKAGAMPVLKDNRAGSHYMHKVY